MVVLTNVILVAIVLDFEVVKFACICVRNAD